MISAFCISLRTPSTSGRVRFAGRQGIVGVSQKPSESSCSDLPQNCGENSVFHFLPLWTVIWAEDGSRLPGCHEGRWGAVTCPWLFQISVALGGVMELEWYSQDTCEEPDGWLMDPGTSWKGSTAVGSCAHGNMPGVLFLTCSSERIENWMFSCL